MLKQQAILATFETLPLDEKRKLLSKIAEKSDMIINDRECEESHPFMYQITYEDIDEKFVEFLFSAYSRVFFYKEDIYKCYRLFQRIKAKCNYVLWRRNEDIRDTFSLAYKPDSNWEVHIVEELYSSCPIRRGSFLENKEEFFTHMLEYCNNGCYVCLMSGGVFDLYESLYDLTIYEDVYLKYIKDWDLLPYSEL